MLHTRSAAEYKAKAAMQISAAQQAADAAGRRAEEAVNAMQSLQEANQQMQVIEYFLVGPIVG